MLYLRPLLVGRLLLALATAVAVVLPAAQRTWAGETPPPGGPGMVIVPPRVSTTPTVISDPSGTRLIIVLNGVRDFESRRGVIEPVGGRWISLDLTVTNVGAQDFALSASNFQILSGDAVVFSPSTDANLPQPQFAAATLPSGQAIRGNVLFDIPVTQTLQSALFQAAGTTQFVIAPIGY